MGSSKISPKLRISLVKDVADKLGVQDGDHVLFYEKEDGEIVIKKG
ncbi:MAG: AbrB/MazE/SpoVT family DNA-binding domain-containing protein [Methanomassiliicoccales archaeon]|nr:AbrB/MazE/SpoVT family DNA-binding domain-containing protein [Methanomassiliicoccales archaeon]